MTIGLPASNIRIVRHARELVTDEQVTPLEPVSWPQHGLDSLAEDVADAILCALPGSAHPDGSYAHVVRQVAREAVRQLAAREAVAGGESDRRRLLDMLVSNPQAPEPVVAALARAAGWQLPRRVSVVVLADWVRTVSGPPPSLPPDVLVDLARPVPCLLVPDPDGPGRPRQLEAGLRGWPAVTPRLVRTPGDGCLAAVGPVVPLGRAPDSLRWARRAAVLGRRGLVGGVGGIIRCDEHMATLILLADTELALQLTHQVLAPLRGLRPHQADRLATTLLAWLESADNAGAAARQLHVHPQTVRYRLRQLMELFGDSLTDPDTRFKLQLALRARQILGDG